MDGVEQRVVSSRQPVFPRCDTHRGHGRTLLPAPPRSRLQGVNLPVWLTPKKEDGNQDTRVAVKAESEEHTRCRTDLLQQSRSARPFKFFVHPSAASYRTAPCSRCNNSSGSTTSSSTCST